jgi:hypothetical protein
MWNRVGENGRKRDRLGWRRILSDSQVFKKQLNFTSRDAFVFPSMMTFGFKSPGISQKNSFQCKRTTHYLHLLLIFLFIQVFF